MSVIQNFHIFFISLIFICSISLILSNNPVHSVLFLILIFFSSASSVILFGVDFIGLLFIIIYVGAIAVLFLFIVMMLDLKVENTNTSTFFVYFIGFSLTFIISLYFFLNSDYIYLFNTNLVINESFNNNLDSLFNIDVFGQSLFNFFIPCFLLAGLILLVAMLGAIVLTFRYSANRKNQISSKQLSRKHEFLSYFA